MKHPEIIIFIESDEISLYLAESILSACGQDCTVHYFRAPEPAIDFIKELDPATGPNITFFINAAILMNERAIIMEIKDLLDPFSSRLCLLTSLANAEKREKEFIREIGISCYIEKPLTEEKLNDALNAPFKSGSLI